MSALTRAALAIAIVVALLVPVVALPPAASANTKIDLTLRITKMFDIGGLDPSASDLYVYVVIDGEEFHSFDKIIVDQNLVFPDDIAFTKSIDYFGPNGARKLVHVQITLWDNDNCSVPRCTTYFPDPSGSDDMADIGEGDRTDVQFWVNPWTGTYTGSVNSPQACSDGGDTSDSGEVCWKIETNVLDSDGDGLLDKWETEGLDIDEDGVIDLDLPAMGANPYKPDIFLELDYTRDLRPRRDHIRSVKKAFAAQGINLWVDTGSLKTLGSWEGQPEGTCTDGIDNNGDGTTDGNDRDCQSFGTTTRFLDTAVEDPPADRPFGNCGDEIDNDGVNGADEDDPSCLVGDNLGGGGFILDAAGIEVGTLDNCGIDATFYQAKNGGGEFQANFDAARALVFHYAIVTSSNTTCDKGGHGEVGGNDFIDHNNDGATVMHELGHNLNLQHGGNDGLNCKPNYVSVMNYDHAFGLLRTGGGLIMDYAPPRVNLNTGSRGVAPLPTLDESNLDETVALDASDASNNYIYTAPVKGVVTKIVRPLSALPDWNMDGSFDNEASIGEKLTGNLNSAGAGRPNACKDSATGETLTGYNDWDNIVLPFQQYQDPSSTAVNPETEHYPTLAEKLQIMDAVNTTDLAVTLSAAPNPVGAGEQITYSIGATNNGPNAAWSTEVTLAIPSQTTFVSATVPCSVTGTQVVCNRGGLLPDASTSFTVTVQVPADLVYNNGSELNIDATANVSNLAGPDSDSSNNTATAATRVISKADLALSASITAAPLEILIGQSTNATLQLVASNAGPSSPVDATVTSSITAAAGLNVTPASTSTTVTALAKDTPQSVTQTFSLSCTAPGTQTVGFRFAIANNDPTSVDPNPANNLVNAGVTVNCVVPIAINVRPGGSPNSINLNTDANMAALTTSAGEYGLPLAFDATKIDPLSVRWGLRENVFNTATVVGAVEQHGKGHIEKSYELDEKTKDADLDMVLHFKPAASGLTSTTTEACLRGTYTAPDGNSYTFLGCDSVRIVPPKK